MNEETRNRLTAWFDGELAPAEQKLVESFLEKDSEARAYVEELKQTREALKTAHKNPSRQAPDWSQFEKRLDPPRTRSAPVLSFPRMILTAAAVLLLGMAVWWPFRQASIEQSTASDELLVQRVELVETDLEGATPIVYLDQPSGWTVVWVVESEEPADI